MLSQRRRLLIALGSALCLHPLAGTLHADEAVVLQSAEAKREFTYSFNIGATSQYIYRGFSQTGGDPTMQGGADVAYGILYAGVWASGIRYEEYAGPDVTRFSGTEWYLYGGIRPTWQGLTFDIGSIYYTYPGGEYVELKAGLGGQLAPDLFTGVIVYWSPDYIADTGNVWTIEGSAAYALPRLAMFAPSVTGQLGWQTGTERDWKLDFANGDDSYLYWNAGLVLAVGALSFDFRYWDTNVSGDNGYCTGAYFQCDAQFVFTTKVVLP